MTFHFTNLPDSYLEGTRRLLALKNCQLCAGGMPVTVCTGDVLRVQIASGVATLTYPKGGFFVPWDCCWSTRIQKNFPS